MRNIRKEEYLLRVVLRVPILVVTVGVIREYDCIYYRSVNLKNVEVSTLLIDPTQNGIPHATHHHLCFHLFFVDEHARYIIGISLTFLYGPRTIFGSSEKFSTCC